MRVASKLWQHVVGLYSLVSSRQLALPLHQHLLFVELVALLLDALAQGLVAQPAGGGFQPAEGEVVQGCKIEFAVDGVLPSSPRLFDRNSAR